MKIKCLKDVCASGVGLEAGKTYDLSSADASFLISIGKAEEYKETPKPKKTEQKTNNMKDPRTRNENDAM